MLRSTIFVADENGNISKYRLVRTPAQKARKSPRKPLPKHPGVSTENRTIVTKPCAVNIKRLSEGYIAKMIAGSVRPNRGTTEPKIMVGKIEIVLPYEHAQPRISYVFDRNIMWDIVSVNFELGHFTHVAPNNVIAVRGCYDIASVGKSNLFCGLKIIWLQDGTVQIVLPHMIGGRKVSYTLSREKVLEMLSYIYDTVTISETDELKESFDSTASSELEYSVPSDEMMYKLYHP